MIKCKIKGYAQLLTCAALLRSQVASESIQCKLCRKPLSSPEGTRRLINFSHRHAFKETCKTVWHDHLLTFLSITLLFSIFCNTCFKRSFCRSCSRLFLTISLSIVFVKMQNYLHAFWHRIANILSSNCHWVHVGAWWIRIENVSTAGRKINSYEDVRHISMFCIVWHFWHIFLRLVPFL